MVAPLVAGDADVVLGSRMLQRGAARRGGMPAYKLVGNRILTRFQNAMAGMSLSEWHSGYRAFSVAALARIPFEANSDGFDFDTEVLLQLLAAGDRIVEVPIPTYYGDEICYVDGLRYARDVASDVVRYRLARIGFGTPQPGTEPPEYEWKPDQGSSHAQLLEILQSPAGRPRARPRLRDGPARCRAPRAVATTSSASTCTTRRRPRSGSTSSSSPTSSRASRSPSTSTGRTTRSSPPTCSSTCAIPAGCWSSCVPCSPTVPSCWPACRTSATGIPGCGWRRAGSTTTPAASSTATTSASSPAAASPG